MRVVELSPDDAERRLHASIDGLAERSPDLSAADPLNAAQRKTLLIAAGIVTLGVIVFTMATLIALMAVITVVYAAAVAYRVAIFWKSLRAPALVSVTDEEARAVDAAELPIYTVLIPAYREPEVVVQLLDAIDGIEYPQDRLDVKLLLEADDEETIAAARAVEDRSYVEIVLVPVADPRTKPKALNFGLALARGEYVTIYDAEDHPDPLQLRRAVVAFRGARPDVACLQARLSYHNVGQNLITKWFTAEYAMWFSLFLPGLSALGAPIPLGGTSNHFRREVLERLGSWDPHNVTEDADLGIRLARQGWSVEVLDSITYEEANSDFVNWAKQRSRWYKGYLQTWLVHLRSPRRTARELGWKSFWQFNLFVGGTPLLALLNPLFWALTILWFVGHPAFIKELFPAPVYYMGVTCWAVGNFTIAYLTVISVRHAKRPELLLAALLVPVYWLMMSIAATKAAIQLATAPSFWEKTTHGLHAALPESGGIAPVAD